MKKLKNIFLLIPTLLLFSCDTVITDSNGNISDSSLANSSSFEQEVDLDVLNKEAFRLSSISDIATSTGTTIYKLFVPYDDTYTISCSVATKLDLYDFRGDLLDSGEKSIEVILAKNNTVYLQIDSPANKSFLVDVTAHEHLVELPYEINSSIDLKSISTASTSDDPYDACKISYTKRDDGKGLYVNCNNPEKLSEDEMDTALTKQVITGKDVFFTFEHNHYEWKRYYYGYRVTNTDTKDIYVTVKNLGFQLSGAGSWLGEDEWIKFYNLNFYSDTSSFTASQKKNYDSYVNFSNGYKSENRKPITYRIPAGKYMYVLGGTTADAYNNINVFSSADQQVTKGGCGNGAVIFSVTGGSALGSFLIYTDKDAHTVNNSPYVKSSLEWGYITTRNPKKPYDVASQYVGYDNCHGVVDADLMWTFNDSTPSGNATVSYSNNYRTSATTGTPFGLIPNLYENKRMRVYDWVTHINPNASANAVGTDMTKYITVDHETQEQIVIDYEHYDGQGKFANIGNWMVDYIDTVTLVNKGEKTRKFTYNMSHNGVILAFIRDENGFVDDSYDPKYCTMLGKTSYGDAISDGFTYTVEIPAHSIARFSVNYNLLANSSGHIKHTGYLA